MVQPHYVKLVLEFCLISLDVIQPSRNAVLRFELLAKSEAYG